MGGFYQKAGGTPRIPVKTSSTNTVNNQIAPASPTGVTTINTKDSHNHCQTTGLGRKPAKNLPKFAAGATSANPPHSPVLGATVTSP